MLLYRALAWCFRTGKAFAYLIRENYGNEVDDVDNLAGADGDVEVFVHIRLYLLLGTVCKYGYRINIKSTFPYPFLLPHSLALTAPHELSRCA